MGHASILRDIRAAFAVVPVGNLGGLPWPAALAIPLWTSGPGGAVTALRHYVDPAEPVGAPARGTAGAP